MAENNTIREILKELESIPGAKAVFIRQLGDMNEYARNDEAWLKSTAEFAKNSAERCGLSGEFSDMTKDQERYFQSLAGKSCVYSYIENDRIISRIVHFSTWNDAAIFILHTIPYVFHQSLDTVSIVPVCRIQDFVGEQPL